MRQHGFPLLGGELWIFLEKAGEVTGFLPIPRLVREGGIFVNKIRPESQMKFLVARVDRLARFGGFLPSTGRCFGRFLYLLFLFCFCICICIWGRYTLFHVCFM